MITEWSDLEGRTIKSVRRSYEGYLLLFEDGEVAHIDGDGEERHGAHWPILSDSYENMIVKEALE